VLEGLNDIQMGDILMAYDIFKSKDNREVFSPGKNGQVRNLGKIGQNGLVFSPGKIG
jgi:hypothetical protein